MWDGDRWPEFHSGDPADVEIMTEMPKLASSPERERGRLAVYSTVTDFARLRGWSTSHPRRTAMW
jgi:hypothetical protein